MICLLVAAAVPGAAVAQVATDTVASIRARGDLVCGVSGISPGFSVLDGSNWRGLDVDYCRAVASVVLGNADRVRFVVASASRRFEMLGTGEIDLLARSTTWTLEREAGREIAFVGVSYYDGQGFLVRRDGGIGSARQLEGATICVGTATTTERNLVEWGRSMRLRFTVVALEYREAVAAFFEQRCDALTSDSSALAALRAAQGLRRNLYALMPEVISKEPLGPAVRKGDWRFFDVVRWTHFALLAAEEIGVTRATIDEARDSPNPDVQRLFGRVGQSGIALGLDADWGARLVRQVGNYGEIWERNIEPLGVRRGPNLLWLHGGLHYAPPMR